MVIDTCLNCEKHEIRNQEGLEESRCSRAGMFSKHTNCIMEKALKEYLSRHSIRKSFLKETWRKICLLFG